MARFLEIETRAGEPILFKGARLIPFSQSWQVRIPGLPIGGIWNRPQSVLVVDSSGEETLIRMPDITRQVIWMLAGASLFSGMLFWLARKRKDNSQTA